MVQSRVGGGENVSHSLSVRCAEVCHTRSGQTAPGIGEMTAVRTHPDLMPAGLVRQPFRLSELPSGSILLHPDPEEVVFDRGDLGRCVPYIFTIICDICHVCIDAGQALQPALHVAEVEVAESVTVVSAVDEGVVAALEEPHGILRLDVPVVVFCQYRPDEISCSCIISIELQVLLASVKNLDEHLGCVRSPCDVGQISVISEVFSLDIYSLAACKVIYSQLNVLRIHSGHRVFDLPERAGPCGDVQQREGGHPAFVLAVEGKASAVRCPEYSVFYAEFIPADELAVGDLRVLADSDRNLRSVLPAQIQALPLCIGLQYRCRRLIGTCVAGRNVICHPSAVHQDSQVPVSVPSLP